MARKILLACGILASLLYVGTDILAAMRYEGYSYTGQTISELSAIGAPTRRLWVALNAIPYGLLVIAFGLGVWRSAGRNRPLRVVGGLLVTETVIALAWPPMHQRAVLAAGGGTLTDTMHIVWTIVTNLFFMLEMGFGAAAFGKRFRFYSIMTMVILIVFGTLTGLDAPRMQANLPTPWIGVKERVNAYGFMLWMAVLAVALLLDRDSQDVRLKRP